MRLTRPKSTALIDVCAKHGCWWPTHFLDPETGTSGLSYRDEQGNLVRVVGLPGESDEGYLARLEVTLQICRAAPTPDVEHSLSRTVNTVGPRKP